MHTDFYHLSDLQQGYSFHRKQDVKAETLKVIFELTDAEFKELEKGYQRSLFESRLGNCY